MTKSETDPQPSPAALPAVAPTAVQAGQPPAPSQPAPPPAARCGVFVPWDVLALLGFVAAGVAVAVAIIVVPAAALPVGTGAAVISLLLSLRAWHCHRSEPVIGADGTDPR